MRRHLAVLSVVLLALALSACSDDDSGGTTAAGPAPDGPEGTEVHPAASRNHVQGAVDYDQRPPAGGDHNQVWHNCGFFTEPVPDELAVHSLEHGAVWVAYGSDVPDDELALLEQRAGAEDYLLVTPYAGLDSPLVLTAWERQLSLDSVGDARFDQFLDAYLQGPTTPEPGAPCDGGVG